MRPSTVRHLLWLATVVALASLGSCAPGSQQTTTSSGILGLIRGVQDANSGQSGTIRDRLLAGHGGPVASVPSALTVIRGGVGTIAVVSTSKFYGVILSATGVSDEYEIEFPNGTTSVQLVITLAPNVSATTLPLIVAAGDANANYGTSAPVTTTLSTVAVASVAVGLQAISVTAGTADQATATTHAADGSILADRGVVWASTNPNVATVNAIGAIATIGAGTTSITATSEGQVGSAALTVIAPNYQLTVTGSGAGTGTVTSSPSGISCVSSAGTISGTCNQSYIGGTVVTLTATPSSGTFAGWSGACSGSSNTCQVTMSQAQSVTASFAAPTFALNVSGAGAGNGIVSSSPTGIACTSTAGSTSGACSQSYASGTLVTLTASATGGTFTGWSGDCAGTSTCQLTLSQVRNVTANFAPAPLALTVNGAGSGVGTITSSPSGISCTSTVGLMTGTCSQSFAPGTIVTLTANPTFGTFIGWSGACTNSSNSCQVTMNQAQSVTASFAAPTFLLAISGSGSGSGIVTSNPAGISCTSTAAATTGTCSQSYTNGTLVTLTATATSGTFSGWSGACSGSGACQVTMAASQTVTATFTGPSSALTVGGTGTGSGNVTSTPAGINCTSSAGVISGTCSQSFTTGTLVTLTAGPTVGTFNGWTGACTNASTTCQVTMTQAQSVTANFAAPTFLLAVSGAGSGNGIVTSSPAGISCTTTAGATTGTCSQSYSNGTLVTLTATPTSGTFTGWSGACAGTGACQVTMAASQSVTATITVAPTQLTITSPPSSTVASGAAFAQQPTIQLRDVGNNPVAQAGVVVTAAIATGAGTLGGTQSVATNASGLATFTNLAITGVIGARTLQFTSPSLTAITSGTITVTPGAATQLALTTAPSASPSSGVVFAQQPVVQLRDASGNAVNQSGVNVTAAITAGGGSLTGTTVVATNSSGTATFTNLVITGPSVKTLAFSAPGVTQVTASVTVGGGTLTISNQGTAMSGTAQSGVPFFVQPGIFLNDGGNVYQQVGIPMNTSLASGTGTLSGGCAATLSTGLSLCPNLTLTGSGSHTITFASPGFQSINSIAINVVAATTPTALVKNTPSALFSGAGSYAPTYFMITVPPGTTSLQFSTSGGSGWAVLYVARNRYPTLLDADCNSQNANTTTQSCSPGGTLSGTWFVAVAALGSYSNVQLLATYSP